MYNLLTNNDIFNTNNTKYAAISYCNVLDLIDIIMQKSSDITVTQ